jgi:Nitroreductase family
MDVYEAVTSRRAVRGFKDEPVSREVLERVLSAAAWSPSGSNIQPWNTYVLTGAPLVLSPSDGLIPFCGMSIGYEDPTVGYARTGRAPLDETVTFVGG